MSEEKRYQLAARLHREGLSKPAVAKQMGITTAGVHDMIKQAERRERIAKAVDDAKDKPMDERGFIEAGLSIRSVNALLCWGDVIGGETIGHLRKWWASVPPHKRLQVPNLGKKSVEEIDALLERTWPNASEEGQE